jgi:hypothetical protein
MANDTFLLPDMSVGAGGGGGGGGGTSAIGFRAASTGSNTSSATPVVVVPATTQGGDLIEIFYTTSTTTPTITDFTSGYTTISEVDDANQRTQIAWKIAAGTPGTISSDASTSVGPTLSATGSKTTLSCVVRFGTHQTAPLEVYLGAAETLTQNSHSTPNVTTTTNGCWIESIWCDRGTVVGGVATNTAAWTLPGGEVARSEFYLTGNAATTLIISDTNQPQTPGSYGNKVANSDFANNNAVMWTVAIKPAAITEASSRIRAGNIPLVGIPVSTSSWPATWPPNW